MSTLDNPAVMNFNVPPEMERNTITSHTLPEKYKHYSIKGTDVTYREGPFGAFFKQEVVDKDWIIGWLNFDIKKKVNLFPITKDPLLALYIGLEGNIPCDLQGSPLKLMLPEKRLGFYYVPPSGFNKAEFEPYHYTSLYISFSHAFITRFREKYTLFQPLLDVPLQQYQQYSDAIKAAQAKGHEGYREFGAMVDKQEKQEAEGVQGLLLPLGSEHTEIIRQMVGYDQNPGWLTPYLYGQIWLMIVSYFALMTERGALPKDVLRAVDYMQTHYASLNKNHQPVTPTDVVAHLKADPRELNRQFNETFGKNMREYLTDLRFAEARFRLRRTDNKLSAIAAETGLSGPSHLTKLIKAEYGLTPAQYRAKYRGS